MNNNIIELVNTFSRLSPENKAKALNRVNEVIESLSGEPDMQIFFTLLYKCLEDAK